MDLAGVRCLGNRSPAQSKEMGCLFSPNLTLPKRALKAQPSLCILQTLVQAVCFKGVVLKDTIGAIFCKYRHLFHLEINLLLREGFRGGVWDIIFFSCSSLSWISVIALNKGLPALCSACST